jgi:hypothetical protein
MSCHTIHNRENINYENVGPYGNSSGSFAPLDIAFNNSLPMSDFQNRIVNQNSLLMNNDNLVPNYETNHINNNIQNILGTGRKILISPQSEEKINNNVDEIVGAYYNRDNDIAKLSSPTTNKQYLYPHVPVIQNGIAFPLTRDQHYSHQQYGSELLEDFNLQQDARNAWNSTNSTSYTISGMSFLKFILLLILIAVLIYGVYWLYKNGSSTTTTETVNKISMVPSSSGNNIMEKLIK